MFCSPPFRWIASIQNFYQFMNIKFVKSVIFKGRVVKAGETISTEFVDASDVRTLVGCGCAIKVADVKPATEKAEINNKVETAVVVSKKSKKR